MAESRPKAQPKSQPDDHPVIQEFLKWIEAPPTRRIGCGGSNNDVAREYISWKTLKEKLTKRKVEELLEVLFENWEYPRPEADYITKHYLRPFAILLCIGQGRMIHHFSEHQMLQDHLLPFRDEPSTFPTSTGCKIFADFRREQWAFCAVRLEYDIRSHLEADEILPITHKERIEEGGSAIAYKIEVDADYDDLVPVTGEGLEPQEQYRNAYVIKTYRSREAQTYYRTERNAFEKLRFHGLPPANIIGFYGSIVREETYNIILEYADLGTLDEYMEHTVPPSSAEEKMVFWENFFDVGHGLATIHGEDEHGGDGPQMLLGWHQDVNPSNILVKSHKGKTPYDCHFKLADLGLSHFIKHTSSRRDATDVDTWGTKPYGAPETRRANVKIEKSRLKIRQDVDIWSMGCVYSEVATWVDQGWNKVAEYRRRRSEEMKEKTNRSEDSFHDGLAVLEAVVQIHHDIVQNHRRNDFITPNVVNGLVKEMLLVRTTRPDARYLFDKSKRILDDAQMKLETTLSYPISPVTARRLPVEPVSLAGHVRQISKDSSGDGPIRPDIRPLNPEPVFPDITSGRGLSSAPSGNGTPYVSIQDHQEPFHQHSRSDTVFTYSNSEQMGDQNDSHHLDRNVGYPYYGKNRTESRQHGSSETNELPLHLLTKSGTGMRNEESITDNREPSDWTDKQQQPPHASSHSLSTIRAEGSSRGKTGQTTNNSRPTAFAEGPNHESTREHYETPAAASDIPHMTVEEGLNVKKEREHGKKVRFPPEDEDLFESLHQRDHAFLLDNSKSMEKYRPQVRKVLELLSYMLGPTDPDGLDLYFTTYLKKLKPGNSYAILAEFDKRKATGLSDMRQRFSNILEDYQKKFGKRNVFSKIRHPNSTPSKGPRKFTLYVLTDGVWQQNITLVPEMKTLVKHMLDHNIANNHIGIQFIRFGNNPTGIKRLKKLDSKKRLGVELDLVDTIPADGNVWKMLLGPLNPWFDDDTEEEDQGDNDDDDNNNKEEFGITVSSNSKGETR